MYSGLFTKLSYLSTLQYFGRMIFTKLKLCENILILESTLYRLNFFFYFQVERDTSRPAYLSNLFKLFFKEFVKDF